MTIKKVMFGMLVAGTFAACGSDTTADNNDPTGTNPGGKGDFASPLVCEIIDKSGTGIDMTGLRDSLAAFVLRGEECPESYAGVVAKLDEAKSEEEPELDGESVPDCNGSLETYVISETAQPSGKVLGSNYRAVVSRKCGDESKKQHMFFSLFGITANAEDPGDDPGGWNIPAAAEIMAYDESAGMFNYYEITNGEFEYFGNSQDFLDDKGGRCEQCHVAGEAVMKELDTPWLHWEGHEDVPGAKSMVDANPELFGRKASGSTLESLVKSSSREYNTPRLDYLRANGTVFDVLEPLFCDVTFNLDNATDFKSSSFNRFPRDFFVHPELGGDSVSIDEEVYEAIIEEFGQEIVGVDTDANDTIFKFVFPEVGFADLDYLDKLTEAGIVDEDYIKDVLMVDFTSPIFSERRCNLLKTYAPVDIDLLQAPAEGEPTIADQIREAFIANLTDANAGADSDEAVLLAGLENAEDGDAHDATVDAFFTACGERDQTEMMRDIMMVTVAYRALVSAQPFMEFPQTMPRTATQADPSTRLDPVTCVAGVQ